MTILRFLWKYKIGAIVGGLFSVLSSFALYCILAEGCGGLLGTYLSLLYISFSMLDSFFGWDGGSWLSFFVSSSFILILFVLLGSSLEFVIRKLLRKPV